MLTTVDVLVLVNDQDGNPVEGATVTAKLTDVDIDSAAGYVLPETVTGTTDATGAATLALWPNELGATESYYEVKIFNPVTGKTARMDATIPNADCDLHLVANLPAYPGKSDGQLAVDAAVATATAAKNEATAQAGTATTQAGISTEQADISTAQAGIATTKAGEAADSAAAAAASAALNQPSNAAPKMDGAAAAGISTDFARADHVHPSDSTKIDISLMGAVNGVATLGADRLIPTNQLPALAITDTYSAGSDAEMTALAAQKGDVCVRTDLNKSYVLAVNDPTVLGNWQLLLTPTDAVLSVAGRTGAVVLTKADVGLANVDNTSDANKPVSIAQQAVLDLKANLAGAAFTGAVSIAAALTVTGAVKFGGGADTGSALKVHAAADSNIEVLTPNSGSGVRLFARNDAGALNRLELQGGSVVFPLTSGADGVIYDAATGNLGVGVSSSSRLTISGIGFGLPSTSGTEIEAAIRIQNGGNTPVLDIGVDTDSTNASWIQARRNSDYSTNYNLILQPNGGNVGFGTTTPQYKGHFFTNSASGYGIQIGGGAGAAGNYTGLLLSIADGSGTAPSYNGAVRMEATASSPSYLDPDMVFLVQKRSTYLLADMVEGLRLQGDLSLLIGGFYAGSVGQDGPALIFPMGGTTQRSGQIRAYIPAGEPGIDYVGLRFTTNNGTTQTVDAVAITPEGKVGVKTISPNSDFHINGDFITIADGTYTGYLGKLSKLLPGGSVSSLGLRSDTDLAVIVNATTLAATFDTAANLLIGSISAASSSAKTIHVENGTAPTADPVGGGIVYVESGALKYRGSAGTVTTIAPA